MTRCGILYNGVKNDFNDYLLWIVNESKVCDDFEISCIHTNSIDRTRAALGDHLVSIAESIDDVINQSDIVYSLGYWKIISDEHIQRCPLGIVNFHHSYMLKHRGRHCSTWVIRSGERYHGSTMHYIDSKLDEGTIIDTRRFELTNSDTASDAFERANAKGFEMLVEHFHNTLRSKSIESHKHDDEFVMHKRVDLNHQLSDRLVCDPELFSREVRSLTFDNVPAPFIVVDGSKFYLKHEDFDDGILRRQ